MVEKGQPRTGRCQLIVIACLAVTALVPACAGVTRYEVLSFFFDGVPDPNAPVVAPYVNPALASPEPEAGESGRPARPKRGSVHPPYRDNKSCRRCHDRSTGQLIRPAREGLCRMCHQEFVDGFRYLHGPAAVDQCLFCHHHHYSARPHVLLDEPPSLCFSCHDAEDVMAGEHHASVEKDRSCTDCHDPHGGDARFFLGRAER